MGEQESIENRLPVASLDGMVGSGWWFWCPRVAEQELIEILEATKQQPGSQALGQPRSSRADAVRLAVAQQHDRLDVDAYTLGARVQARIRERAHGPRQRVRLVSGDRSEIGQRAPWLQSRCRVRWRPSLQRRRWRQYEWRRRPACSKRIYPKRGWWRGAAPARPPASGIAAGAGA